jgi:hypothetical protein
MSKSFLRRLLASICPGLVCLLSLPWAVPAADPRIEEFMAVNQVTLVDEDGDRPDWIEIYNYTGYTGLDLSAMLVVNETAYARIRFNVANPAAYQFLTLWLRYEDGMIAWLNGVHIAADNAPPTSVWNSGATANQPDNVAVQVSKITLTVFGPPIILSAFVDLNG